MKTLSLFDVQEINDILNNKPYDYVLKLKDVCGSQALSLECTGSVVSINELCDYINEHVSEHFFTVIPGTINPYQVTIK